MRHQCVFDSCWINRSSVGSATNDRTTEAYLRGRLRVFGVGSTNRIAPIAHVGVLRGHKLKEPSRDFPSGLQLYSLCSRRYKLYQSAEDKMYLRAEDG